MKNSIQIAPNLSISRVVTGLWQIADMERDGQILDAKATSQFMHPYVDAGLTSFDMADHYGSSEIITGQFKNDNPNKKVQLFTKWVPNTGKITREDTRSAIELSLQRMGQSSIHLLQFHAWHYPDPSWIDGLFYLKELQEEGLIKNLGVTNFDSAHLQMAVKSGIPLVTNQVCHSLIDSRAQNKMTEVCLANDIKLLAFGTLAGGFLTDKWLGKKEPSFDELSTWSEMKYKRFIDTAGGWAVFQNLLETVRKIADKHQSTIAAISSRYILENPAVAAVIVGARLGKSEHINDNISMLKIELSAHDIGEIKKAQEALAAIPGDCGDEYRTPPFLTASGDLSHHIASLPQVYVPVKIDKDRSQIFSGTVWEQFAGYCRAVKEGNRIHISGTTATHGNDMIGGNDPTSQTHFVIDKIEAVLESFGSSLKDVVRTRIFVNNLDDWEPVARAHGERFNGINPANTLVQANLVGEGYLVEIEAEAVVKK